MSRPPKGLTPLVVHTLRDLGLDPWDYVRFYCGAEASEWYGDSCGCHDDRCRGYHHDPAEQCGCFAVGVAEVIRAKINQLQGLLSVLEGR